MSNLVVIIQYIYVMFHGIISNTKCRRENTVSFLSYLNMSLEPRNKGNSSYLRGQGVKNKLPTLELKLFSSVNGLFLTGTYIYRESKIFYNIKFIFECRLLK